MNHMNVQFAGSGGWSLGPCGAWPHEIKRKSGKKRSIIQYLLLHFKVYTQQIIWHFRLDKVWYRKGNRWETRVHDRGYLTSGGGPITCSEAITLCFTLTRQIWILMHALYCFFWAMKGHTSLGPLPAVPCCGCANAWKLLYVWSVRYNSFFSL